MNASSAGSTLPAPSAEQARHAAVVGATVRRAIEAAGGWLSFERFMRLALYEPGLGYYSAGSVKLGAQGDFVTAPEVSDLFSRCVARQCAEVLAATGGSILELGAGSGRMAATILTSLAEHGCLPERYWILEVSADLAQRQRERLSALPPELARRVGWIQALSESALDGVVLANEVMDAIPFQRFVVHEGLPYELGVVAEAAGLRWGVSPVVADRMRVFTSALDTPLPEGYRSEVCFALDGWIGAVAAHLRRGALLLFDYGLPRRQYYHRDRMDGTLRCYFRHRAHDDPFVNVGIQDVTAWVDFTRVAEAASENGLTVGGFATQAAFLLGTGIEQMLTQSSDPVAQARLAGEARRLLLPGEMGESFKVMALTRRFEAPLCGFVHQDLRPSL